MSRIGKKPIELPENVQAEIGQKVSVKGPLGTLSFKIPKGIKVETLDKQLNVRTQRDTEQTKALHGLTRSLIANMVEGVSKGFEKSLELSGIGFRANLSGEKLVLTIGYSHPVEIEAPEGIKFSVSENKITVSGIDKSLVGKVASEIRSKRPPDAYKGKGIRYVGELVKLKPGKAAKTATGTA